MLAPLPPKFTSCVIGAQRGLRCPAVRGLLGRALTWSRQAAGEQHPGLDQVEGRRPPVQSGAPAGEGPPDDPGDLAERARVRPEEQQRKCIQKAKSSCFPHKTNLQGAKAEPALQKSQ